MRFTKHLLLAAAAALAATGMYSCSIPKPECTVGQSGYLGGLSGNDYLAFAVRYVPTDGNPNNCPVMTGEMVGMQSYHPSKEGDDQNRDFSRTSIAIRTQSSGELYWMIEDFFGRESPEALSAQPNAEGPFVAAEPDGSDLCQVTTFTQQSFVDFPGGVVPLVEPAPDACATDQDCEDNVQAGSLCVDADDQGNKTCVLTYEATALGYTWSNVEVYVTAAAPGTQFRANVDITINGCTASYKAVGMWPAVDCTDYYGTTDATGAVVAEPTFGPDDRLCNPEPDPEGTQPPVNEGAVASLTRVVGSGISPDFGPTRCDTTINAIPIVDKYYTDLAGFTISVPRCALAVDDIPALEGYSAGGDEAGGEE